MAAQERVGGVARRHVKQEVPAWVRGVWRRDRVERGDGSVDRDTTVIWLQTPTLFADIRIPKPGRRTPEVQAFAGWLTVEGQVCTWNRPIDLAPPPRKPDIGAMFRAGGRMIECGVQANYLEDWRLMDDGDGRFLALGRGGRSMDDLLVTAADHFMIATRKRGRCELSYGRIDLKAKAWCIELSTTPGLQGQRLFRDDRWEIDRERGLMFQHVPGRGSPRRWPVWSCTLGARQLAQILPS